jgi:hypothetical protein
MDIGLLISPAVSSAAQPSSIALGERGQLTQPSEGGAFSVLFNDCAQNIPDEGVPLPSQSDDPTEPTSPANAGEQATLALVMGVTLASMTAVRDPQLVSSAETDSVESAQNAQRSSPQGIEPIPFVIQDVRVVQTHEAGATGEDSTATEAALPTTRDLSSHPAVQPLVDPAQSGEAPAMAPKQSASRTTDESSVRNGRGGSVYLGPVPFKQPSDDSGLLSTPPQGSLIPDELPPLVVENQETRNLLPAASVNGGVHSLDRQSTGIQSSVIIPGQGTQGTTLLGQSLSTTAMGESGRGQENSSGADGQGQGEGALFHSRTNRVPESLVRDNQSALFIDQFTSVQQTRPSPLGEGSPTVPSAADHLKMTQAFLGEDHSATMMSGPRTAQTVHLELPSHDSGPLSVRISMTDQTVHTQFTTDRSDLGQFLLTRQDQLQQNLTKSGLELGQFQVHIDYHGQQEAPPEWQSRRQGEAREDNRPPHQAEQQDQDRKQQHARSTQALSVFA